jgi:ketosteroid isomerase-like protein
MTVRTVGSATRQLQALYEEWFARVGPSPGDFFDRVLSDDWVYIDYRGVTRGKADYVPYIAGVTPETAPRSPQDLHVRLVGPLAIVHGSYTILGGTEHALTLRFTAVWKEDGDSWRALAHHTSAVMEPPSASTAAV